MMQDRSSFVAHVTFSESNKLLPNETITIVWDSDNHDNKRYIKATIGRLNNYDPSIIRRWSFNCMKLLCDAVDGFITKCQNNVILFPDRIVYVYEYSVYICTNRYVVRKDLIKHPNIVEPFWSISQITIPKRLIDKIRYRLYFRNNIKYLRELKLSESIQNEVNGLIDIDDVI